MKKNAVIFLCLFILLLSACSEPLEGVGVKPEPVQELNLNGSDGSLTVSWDKVYLADSYMVYYSNEQNIPTEPYTVVKETSITISNLLNDVTYYVWVLPSNKRGEWAPQNVFTGTIPLAVPTGVILNIPKGDTIEVSWNSVVLAEEYEVFCKTSPIPPDVSDTPDQTVSLNSAILSNLDQPDYYIWVRAKNRRGKSALSAMMQDIFSLSEPAEVILCKTANDTIEVSWNSVVLAEEYEVFCKTSQVPPDVSDTPEQTVSSNSALLSSLDQPDYYIWIRAKNSRGKSSLSAMVQDSFVVSNFRVAAVTTNSVSLEWSDLSNASGYIVYRSTGENGIYDRLNTVVITDTRFTDTELDVYTTYYYKISAVIGGDECLQSNTVSATTFLPSPENVRVTISASSNSISLEWDIVSDAGGYNVYRSTIESGIYSRINNETVIGTIFTDTDITALATYYYRISAISSGGVEGQQSNTISAVYGIWAQGSTLAAKLSWLQNNIESDNMYGIEISSNESIDPQTLSYSGRNNIFLVLRGTGTARTISLSSNGSLFTVNSSVTLILDNNIILQGRSTNNSSLVYVNSGGMFIMNAGSEIKDNTTSGSGGGVYVSSGTFIMNDGTISNNRAAVGNGGGVLINNGIFTMNGGTIYANTASGGGGGVYVYSNSVFTKTGGTIIGYSSDMVYGNVVNDRYGTVQNNQGHAVYVESGGTVKRKETTAGSTVNLSFNGTDGSFSGGWDY